MDTSYHTVQQLPLFVFSKCCSRCHIEKPLEAFGKQTGSPHGRKPHCKECETKQRRQKRAQELGVPVSQIARKVFPQAQPEHKYCFSCDQEKPFQAFHKKKGSPDGYASHCKDCRNELGRSTYAVIPEGQRKAERRQKYINNRASNLRCSRRYATNHPETKARLQRKYRIAHPDVYRNHGQKRRARIRNVSTEQYIDYQSIAEQYGYTCHICSQPIDPSIKTGPTSLVFDHLIPLFPRPGEPQGTHTSDNIRPSHWICNARKNNKSMSSLTEWDQRGPNA